MLDAKGWVEKGFVRVEEAAMLRQTILALMTLHLGTRHLCKIIMI